MAAFEYVAMDARGKNVKGVLEGDNARQIRQQLRDKALTPMEVNEANSSGTKSKNGKAIPAKAKVGGKLSATDLTLLTRQLATLVKSGMPIEKALNSVSQQTDKQKIKTLLLAIRAKVLEGHSLADAFGQFPHVFPEIYRSTIASGEASGHLDTVLMRLADYAELRHEMSKKLMESLMYPVIVVCMSFAILTLLLAFVVPKVVSIFESNDAQLPVLTQAIIFASDVVQNYWWLFLIIAVAAVFGWQVLMAKESRRYAYHQILLTLPLLGKMIQARNASAFARTLGILVGSSVSVLEAMRIASDVLTSLPMKQAVLDAANQVKEGVGISKSLEATGYFPGMMLHLIHSGEASGSLDEMLISAADYQEMEVQAKTSALLAASQPLVIVFLGGLVMLIMMGILMPIFDMNNLIQA